MEESKYVNGGSQLKMSIKVEDFASQIKELADNGWVNLIISKRKEPSDTGITHYVKVDTWKPDPNKVGKPNAAPVKAEAESDLPF